MAIQDPGAGREGHRGWQTPTQWSLVLRATRGDAEERQAALSRLCETYRGPVHAYLRHHPHWHEQADDLTQAFFLHLLTHEWPAAADPEKGRFRALLLTTLKRFLIDTWRRRHTARAGGSLSHVSLDLPADEPGTPPEPADTRTPDLEFDRRWARQTLEIALGRLEQECVQCGRQDLFAAIGPFLTPEGTTRTLTTAATHAGLTDGAMRMAVLRLRQRYRVLLRETVADTLADPSKVDEELHELRQVLQDGRPG